IAGCCSALGISEPGRIAVSGPEVIETNRGVEEFDSRDRALVWRTMGGKHRRLLAAADIFIDDTIEDFREAALKLLGEVGTFGLDTLQAEQLRLADRLARYGACEDAVDIWTAEGVEDAMKVPDMPVDRFIALASRIGRAGRDAR